MFTFGDVTTSIVDKLRGRQDVFDNILLWIQEAVIELTENYEFEELKSHGILTNFIQGQHSYPLDYFSIPNERFTKFLSFQRFFTTINPPTLGIPSSQLKGRDIIVVDQMSNILGLPINYAQSGTRLIFGFCPDQSYTVRSRYQREHPFDLKLNTSSQVFMPNDWKEIVAYSAAIRGCEFVGMNELSMEYYKKLFGDPKTPKQPGLILSRQSQQQRNMSRNERQIQPVVRRYR